VSTYFNATLIGGEGVALEFTIVGASEVHKKVKLKRKIDQQSNQT
jgi:hypothetical protein